jgi:hypothetical protein
MGGAPVNDPAAFVSTGEQRVETAALFSSCAALVARGTARGLTPRPLAVAHSAHRCTRTHLPRPLHILATRFLTVISWCTCTPLQCLTQRLLTRHPLSEHWYTVSKQCGTERETLGAGVVGVEMASASDGSADPMAWGSLAGAYACSLFSSK